MLDLIGDLSLVGRRIHARFVAIKPSHALNTLLARDLAIDFAA
jgi:UDP-3-O-acyl-N-acetylglucosamine deacetylase